MAPTPWGIRGMSIKTPKNFVNVGSSRSEGGMSSTWQLYGTAATAIIVSLAIPLSTTRGADSVTVHLSVDATESFGNPLSYSWRTTDGRIEDGRIVAQDSATADWT